MTQDLALTFSHQACVQQEQAHTIMAEFVRQLPTLSYQEFERRLEQLSAHDIISFNDKLGRTLLDVLAQSNQADKLEWLLKLFNFPSGVKTRALMFAAREEALEAVLCLVFYGARLGGVPEKAEPLLHQAARNKNLLLARALLAAGAKSIQYEGKTPAQLLCEELVDQLHQQPSQPHSTSLQVGSHLGQFYLHFIKLLAHSPAELTGVKNALGAFKEWRDAIEQLEASGIYNTSHAMNFNALPEGVSASPSL